MRACLLAACLLATAHGLVIQQVRAADPPPTSYRLEPKTIPDIAEGKAVMVRGRTTEGAQRFFLEHLHMMVPVVVTLRPLRPEDRLDLAIGKYPWAAPLREGRAEDGGQVSFSFRTEGEFQVAVSSPEPGTAYKLLVWVGDEVKPSLKPVIVPASEYQGETGRGVPGWAWMALALVVLAAGGLAWTRRKRA